MKLSLAWIFDHIDSEWKKQDINLILSKFNTSTAEIENFEHIKFDLRKFYVGRVVSHNDSEVKLSVPELDIETVLLPRKNTTDLIGKDTKNTVFMITKQHSHFSWTLLQDLNLDKDGFVPALDISDKDLSGAWRQSFECEDIVIEVDNKSITHRPDMWGHRGFAREIAALLNLPLKDAAGFLAQNEILCFDQKSKILPKCPIIIENKTEKTCTRFSGLYFKSIENRPSNPFIVSRLLKVGSRPINGIIDMANYLMLDWSQPVHAYDVAKIDGQKIIIRMAKPGEKLLLLDGVDIELTHGDMVIADEKKPLCLAGVMGGVNSSVDQNTQSILFESATFDAATVRRSAFYHKTRTDSSARFEKTIDPNQSPEAILRFIYLLKKYNINAEYSDQIVSIGHAIKGFDLEIEHSFFEKRVGVKFSEDAVVKVLEKIGFKVEIKSRERADTLYSITVPSFRGCKDIKIKEDILEEVLRFYGFDKVPLTLPCLQKIPFDFGAVTRLRKIKNYLVGGAKMTEQQNYSFADEEFLSEIDLKMDATPRLLNPVSQNNVRLVDSLVPTLFKNIKHNHVHRDTLSFFEFGRVWSIKDKKISERKSLAGIFFSKRKKINFYECKQQIVNLLEVLDFDVAKISWKKIHGAEKHWYSKSQSANIILHDKNIGKIGNADTFFLSKLKIHDGCSAFVFELDGDYLLTGDAKIKRFSAVSKFPESYFDLSFMTPLSLKFIDVKYVIEKSSTIIKTVELIDLFEKDDWVDARALTFRVWVERFDRNLEKSEIDETMQQAINNVTALGAKLRV